MTSTSPPEDSAPAFPILIAAALLLLATGAYGSFFWLTHDEGPPAGAFGPAAEVIRAGFRPGDLVFLAPFYATRAREHLGDLRPLAVRSPAAEDLETRARIWVFALFGAERKLGPQLEAAGFRPAFTRYMDGIAVLRYERAPRAAVTFDFVEAIRQARVYHERGGERVPCDRWESRNRQGGPPGRWVCPVDGDWFYVAPEWHRMGDHLRWCLWAHPPNDGTLVVEYDAVTVNGVVAGRGGHTLNASVHARAPVYLDVAVGGHRSQRIAFALDDYFRPFRVRVPTATTTSVAFRVSSPDAGVNHFCFTADVRAPVAEVGR